ncbi:calcium-binding protein [Mesorhizobium sp. CN2-181]|uniref:calcium-binding protein n=1 Tax=Mesorhizobium yinganensis TaxID=3157707 RepID=UPI0032B7425F
MIVNQFVSGMSAAFSLGRSGDQLAATFHYDLTGFEDESGVFQWDGEIGAEIGGDRDYLRQTADRSMDLQFVATLTPGMNTTASYFVNDNIGGAAIERQFNVALFDAAADFAGTSAVDLVFGSAFADEFRSEGAGDMFEGGGGSDLYRVYSADTKVLEAAGGGINDRVAAGVSYLLAAGVGVERLTTNGSTDTAAINLTGNELSQTIHGNAGANVLADGGGAGDVLIGLGGNDTYRIDSTATAIREIAGQGNADTVMASISYTLASGVGVEILTTADQEGTTNIDLTGNALHQDIVGNAGSNMLRDGGGAVDTLRGLAGNDTYQVYSSGTTVVEGADGGNADRVMAGVDYALSSGVQVEILTTNGSSSTLGIDLAGNEFGQKIIGNAGSNIIAGRGGLDTLFGLGGADFFAFISPLGANNVSTIGDFSIADDTIYLDSAVFGVLPIGALHVDAFKDIAAAPKDFNDRIIYNSETGALYYDADGSGTAFGNIKFATLAGIPNLTHADLVVI